MVETRGRDGADGDVGYQVQFGADGASVTGPGAGAPADVVLVTDPATAWALHQGTLRAQDAFARGALKLRGRPELLAGARRAPRRARTGAWPRCGPRPPSRLAGDPAPGRLGAVQPFERLRAIARHGGDDRLLVAEAADCLGEFDDDPAALVVTCRRLLHHHPERAPLWWLCARVLGGARAVGGARGTPRRWCATTTPPTASSGVLPFPADHPIAVLGWPAVTGDALALRPDLEVLVVRDDHPAHRRRTLAGPPGPQRRQCPSRRPRGGRRTGAVAPADRGGRRRARRSCWWPRAPPTRSPRSPAPGWSCGSSPAWVGCCPTRLFDAMVRTLGDPEEHGLELLDVQVADRIAGPTGLVRPEHLARRVDCPVAPELLRLS